MGVSAQISDAEVSPMESCWAVKSWAFILSRRVPFSSAEAEQREEESVKGKEGERSSQMAMRSASKLLQLGSTASESLLSKPVTRRIHSTGVKRMGGDHGHGHNDPEYMHAYHMYNLDKMKNQGLKMSLAVFTAFSIGVVVPVFAVVFQQKKTASA